MGGMPHRRSEVVSMKQPIALRIEVDLLEAVRRCAAEENRTLTNFIETVLRSRVGLLPPRGGGTMTRASGPPRRDDRLPARVEADRGGGGRRK